MDNLSMISEKLNEEKWTRATLNSYTISNFEELDTIVDAEYKQEKVLELKALCDEHLLHTKTSLIALYISGVISFLLREVDVSKFIDLIDLFKENHRWNIVEFLCERILKFGENKYALRTLVECYEANNEENKKIAIWERLIRIDYEEADIVKQLADLKKESGDMESAISFYKRALYRYINKKNFTQVKEIWGRMIELALSEKEFFFQAEKKISAAFDTDKINLLLDELYKGFKAKEDWKTCVVILKQILTYKSDDPAARRELVDCFRKIHEENPHIEEYITLSNLNQSVRNVHEAISDFEKHISFDKGRFVFHRTWGTGYIKDVSNDELCIDFARKRNHTMSLKMASNSLVPLPKNHIWVLKSVLPAEKLKEKLKNDVLWGLKILITSFDNATSLKKIKAELVPSVFTQNEWNSWSNEAKKILKNDPLFGNLPDQVDIYEVRTTAITLDEKIYNQFSAETNFYGKIKAIREYILNGDPEADFFTDMYNYVSTFTKNLTNVNDQVISAWLFRKWSSKRLPHLTQSSKTFSELISKVENIVETFNDIQDSELKQDFLDYLKEIRNWNQIYVSLFPSHLNKFIIDELVKFHHEEDVKSMFETIVERWKENKNSFLWIAKNIDNIEEFGIAKEQLLVNLIHLLDVTARDIDNKQDVSNSRKYNKNAENLLIKDQFLEKFLQEASLEAVERIMELLSDIRGFSQTEFENLMAKMVARFPDFTLQKAQTMAGSRESITRGLIVSKMAYKAKQRSLKYIVEVEIPRNAKEIGKAIELGDLRENAEYKAGKEKQQLLDTQATKLKEDLEKARIFDFAEVDTSRVGYGTVVTLKNNKENTKVTYTILGPWESDPDNGIISYQSPLGKELVGFSVGENLQFIINEVEYDFVIESIQKAEEPQDIAEDDEKVHVDFI